MVKKKIKDEGLERRTQIASAFGEIEQSKIFLDKRTEWSTQTLPCCLYSQ